MRNTLDANLTNVTYKLYRKLFLCIHEILAGVMRQHTFVKNTLVVSE